MSDRNEKKAQFEKGKKKSFLPLIVVALIVLGGGAFLGGSLVGGGDGKYPLVKASGGQIAIPLAQVNDGKAHFFSYAKGDDVINFFLLKSDDGVIRAALDTCDVCYKAQKGYRQDGDFMVCNNCEQRFRSNMINEVKGGCNPAPIQRNLSDDKVIIAETELAQGARFFKKQGS